MESDTENDLKKIVEKLTTMRIITDENGKMNKSITETKGEILLIPQFTLCAETQGRRPSFSKAKNPKEAKTMFENGAKMLRGQGIKTEKGVFGAYMQVASTNDGPVTFIIDSEKI
jgi:D-tyrosyl-tRNA(Tyr) deacylase